MVVMKKAVVALGLLAFSGLYGQLNYEGCDPVSGNDLQIVDIITGSQDPSLEEPISLAFDMDAGGNVDVYYIQRRGQVKRFRNGSVETLGTIPVLWEEGSHEGNVEEGLVGIALDPDFKTNNYMYFMYSPLNVNSFRISRMTLEGNNLNTGNEKILLDIPTQRDECCHTGGGMQFDAYGDLWVTIGNNADINNGFINEDVKWMSDEWGASSTAGLRGGIIRIHPDESEKGYSIPEGNFGEYYSDYWEQQGNSQLATEYANPAKVLPEIYVKGTRNAYTLTLDPVRRWAFTGDVGPDFAGITEEFNLFTKPVFAGWPYWAGKNALNQDIPASLQKTDPNNPMNTSKWNEGVTQLPPAFPATIAYAQSASITGPMYRYDGSLQSNVKLPPHFDRMWFLTDNNDGYLKVVAVNEDGTVNDNNIIQLKGNDTFVKPLDMQQGPDGALYVIDYGGSWFSFDQFTKIRKIQYSGSCRPTEPVPEYAACMDPNYAEYDANAAGHDSSQCLTSLSINGSGEKYQADLKLSQLPNGILNVEIQQQGEFSLEIFDMAGKLVHSEKIAGKQKNLVELGDKSRGLLAVFVENQNYRGSQKILR